MQKTKTAISGGSYHMVEIDELPYPLIYGGTPLPARDY
jgi:hypothetical protein